MKSEKIIKFIIEQELEDLDDFQTLVKPISEKFNIKLDVADSIINEVVGWEGSSKHESLESLLNRLFPDIESPDINKEIYNCLNTLSNSVGKTINEYHWREFCGLMKMMEDNNMVDINDIMDS